MLPADYDADQNPLDVGTGGHTSVYIGLLILDISSIDQERMTFVMQLVLITQWTDSRLLTNASNPRRVLPEAAFRCLWTPSVVFGNIQAGAVLNVPFPHRVLSVFANQTVQDVARMSITVRCPMILTRFPFDVQDCSLLIRTLDEPIEKVQLKWMDDWLSPYKGQGRKAVEVDRNISPMNFRLVIPPPFDETREWIEQQHSFLVTNITLYRKLRPYLFTMYLPAISTVVISFISFWIDVDAVPGRVTIGVTTSLSMMTQLYELRKVLPPLNYITALDIYLFTCLTFVSLSLIEYAFGTLFDFTIVLNGLFTSLCLSVHIYV